MSHGIRPFFRIFCNLIKYPKQSEAGYFDINDEKSLNIKENMHLEKYSVPRSQSRSSKRKYSFQNRYSIIFLQ